jgi:hypothetical protein
MEGLFPRKSPSCQLAYILGTLISIEQNPSPKPSGNVDARDTYFYIEFTYTHTGLWKTQGILLWPAGRASRYLSLSSSQ